MITIQLINEKGRVVVEKELHTFPAILGRSGHADICVGDDTISPYHLQIIREGDQWIIRDMGSKNGIYRNGVRCEEFRVHFLSEVQCYIGRLALRIVNKEDDTKTVSFLPRERSLGTFPSKERISILKRIQDSVEHYSPNRKSFLFLFLVVISFKLLSTVIYGESVEKNFWTFASDAISILVFTTIAAVISRAFEKRWRLQQSLFYISAFTFLLTPLLQGFASLLTFNIGPTHWASRTSEFSYLIISFAFFYFFTVFLFPRFNRGVVMVVFFMLFAASQSMDWIEQKARMTDGERRLEVAQKGKLVTGLNFLLWTPEPSRQGTAAFTESLVNELAELKEIKDSQ